MRWDRFFEDLEDQLDSEWEAERAALDTEAERLRLSQVSLRERIVALVDDPRAHTAHLLGGGTAHGRVARVGADWVAVVAGDARAGTATIVPLWAIAHIAAPADAVLASVRSARPGAASARRMGFGFVLRDLVRRRIPVSLQLPDAQTLTGTLDRAGADHLDVALHDAGAPRRPENIAGYRIVPFAAVRAVHLASVSDLG